MSSPPFKRQRTGRSALNAPFKSPVPRKTGDSSSSSTPASTSTSTPASTSKPKPTLLSTQSAAAPAAAPSRIARDSPLALQHQHQQQGKAFQAHRLPSSPSSFRYGVGAGDSEVKALQSTATSLSSQLSSVRNALDTATQAARLEQSTRDAELERLIVRWTAAARGAAEELLTLAQDKVNAMGGLQAYRAREVERVQRRQEAFAEMDGDGKMGPKGENEDEDEDGDGNGERERERRPAYVEDDGREDQEEDPRADGREEANTQLSWMKSDEHSFTMDMLLKSLGIEPRALGYDATEHRWVD